jgi:hypothetical protein
MAKIHQALWFRFLLLTILSSMAWAQLPVTDDTYVSSAAPTTNNGNSPSLVVQAPGGWTLIKLDLSQLPTGTPSSAVTKATLKLYVTAATAQGSFDLFRVDTAWKEGTLTYSSSTTPYQSAQTLTFSLVNPGTACPSTNQCVTTASKYVIVDVTSIVKDWLDFQNGVAGAHANNGIALKPSSGSSISVTLDSKESTTSSHAPEIDFVLNTSLSQIQGQIGPNQVAPGTYNISITGNAASATSATTAGSATTASSAGVAGALALTPSQCGATLFATGIQANGNANCSGITNAHLPSSVVYNNQGNTFAAGFKQTFTANGTYAGLNIAGISVNNPTGLAAGDVWFRLDLKHLHFYDGSTTHQLMFRDDTIPESQVTNLTTDLATQTTNLNNEIANRQAAVTAEATARATADATLQSNINAETTRAQGAEATLTTNLTNEITRATTAENTKADLVKPVQVNNSALMGGSCTTTMANAMVLNPTAPVGQQLLICQMVGSNLQWVLVNDEQALTQQLTLADQTITTNLNNEISRAEAAESTLQTNINNEASTRQAADTAEANARIAADNAETVTRAAADTALANSIVGETARAQGAETTLQNNIDTLSASSAKLTGDNTFSGKNIFTGNTVDLSQSTVTLPVRVDMAAMMNTACSPKNSMVLNPTQAVGQQLMTCQTVNNQLQWVLVNDEQALSQQFTQAINTETARAELAESNLSTAIGNEVTRATGAESTLQGNIDALSAASAKLASPNTFIADNIFTGAKVDLSHATATLPVQTITGAPSTGPNICVAGQMALQKDAPAGQQLFICNASLNGWVMVNDDTATTSAANQYTDQQVLIEKNRAMGVESALTTSIANEAVARVAGDAATLASANTYTDNTKTNILTQPQTFSGNETLSGNNSFTGSNTFSGAKVDLSGAGATLPVQTTTGTVPTSGSANACVDGEMLMKVNGAPGQQLFICNATHDGWVMVNDDTATASAANAYTDSKVAAEATARIAGDATTLSSANSFTITAVANEAAARIAGDAATLASANTYTDNTKTNILTQPQTFSGNETLSGNNSFTGSNTFSGAKVDLSGAGATLPVKTTTGTVPASGSANACFDGEMLMKVNGAPGQQLFICNAAHDGWVLVNDDTATASAANAYTDSKVAAEAAARTAADTAEATARIAADSVEALARTAGDATTLASANTYTDNTKTNILTQPQTFSGNETLSGNNSFTGSNTFSGAKVDLSGAGATLPVQTTTGTVPTSGSVNACVDGEMLMKVNGTPGQQLFICNAAHDGWVMVNDDTATASAANAYTDSKVATEAAARIAGDAATLSSANGFTTTAVANEAAARVAGDTAAVASANAYTDAGLALKANLAGGNNFTGDQSITGKATVNGTVSLPALSTTANTPSASQRLNLQGWDGSNATVFQWLVNDTGKLDLFTGVNGQNSSTSGLMIGPDGKITFASSQTFPGTQNTLTAGTGISIASNTISNTATTTVDGTTIHNSGSALNPVLSVGAIGESQVTNLSSDLLALSASIATKATAASIADATNTKITYNSQGIVTAGAQAQFSDIGGTATSSQLPTDVAYNDVANAFSKTQALGPKGATSQPSNALQLNATDASSTSQSAQLQAKADGSLSFQFGPTAGPIADKLSIAPTGVITFAPGQTFPGTNNGTVTSVGTGTGLTGGTITTSGTISLLPATGATLGGVKAPACAVGSHFSGIAVDGTLVCTLDATTTSLPFSAITAGVNTAALTVDSGGSLSATGTGIINATQLGGVAAATYVRTDQANTYGSGNKQTFKASATLAGLSFDGGVTNDPSTLASGDTWFNSTASHLKFFDGTTTKTLAFTTDIAAGTVTGTGLTSGQLIVGNGGSSIGVGNLTGDVTTSGGTLTALAGTIGGTRTFSGNVTFSNQITGSVSGTANNVTGTVGIGNGGTGLSLASVAAGSYLRGTGTTFAVSPIQAADIPSLSGTYVDLTSNQTIAGTKTFNGTPVFGSTANGNGGLLIPPNHNGSGNPSFPFDMEATNTANNLHLFRIVAQDGTTPKWDFQFCNNNTPCTPTSTGFSITSTGAVTATSSLVVAGSTSGTASIAAQAAAGTPTLTLPNASGTFAVSASSPLVLSATTGALTCPTCGTGSGTVTQVDTGTGLTGGPVTSTGTIALANTTVTPGTYTAANVTVDQQGRITAASSNTIPTSPTFQTNGTNNSSQTTLNLTNGTGITVTNPAGGQAQIAMKAPQNTRAICYVAGADNSTAPVLTTNDSQKSFFNNLIGAMTITSATCQVDAGSVTMNVQKNNLASAITTSVACTSAPGTWQTLTVSGTSLGLGDSLDLSIAGVTTAKRLTVCLAGTVN